MDIQDICNLQKSYLEVYNIQESHFSVGDEVICKKSGMEGEVVKVDKDEKGKYYTVKREDGKKVKYAPDELKMEDENEGASKKEESKFHKNLDTLVHKTFGKRPEEEMKEQVDIYDIILSHLLDEGYAETLEAAEVMMVNMSEEWRDSILSEGEYWEKRLKSIRSGEKDESGLKDYWKEKQNNAGIKGKRKNMKK